MGARGEPRPVAVVFRTGQLGDSLVALPAMELIRRRFPDHRFVLLTDRHPASSGYISSWDLFGPTGWFEHAIFYDPEAHGWQALRGWAALLLELRGLNVDQFFNLAPGRTDRQAARDRWVFKRIVRPRVYHSPATLRSPVPDAHKTLPRVEPEWRHTLRSVGARDSEGLAFRFSIPDSERDAAQRTARAEGVDPGARLLAFGPGSKMQAKRWPAERYAELGMRLRKEFPELQLVVLGGKEDIEIGQALCAQWGRGSHNLAGKLSLHGSAAVLERCLAYVGNDTGTMHLAAMSGIPCVAIFSARDFPGRWDPYGEGHVVLRHEVECAGCLLEVCRQYDNKCLKGIGVEQVYRATKQLLAKSTAELHR